MTYERPEQREKHARGVSTYLKVGRCVYCRSTDPPLTTEHIIPQGLGGTDVLLAASCEECRKKTHAVETKVLRGGLWPLRRRHGLHGRRQPETITAFGVDKDGRHFRERLEPSQIAVKAGFPVFKTVAGRLEGKPQKGTVDLEAVCLVHDRTVDRGPHAAGSTFELPLRVFGQMLTKIAHCAAVKDFGVDAFVPFLPPIILGKDTKWPAVIGRPYYEVVPPTHLNCWVNMVHDVPQGLLVAHVQLFAGYSTPIYEVLIGQYWGGPPSRCIQS